MTPDKAYPQAERDRLIGIASRPATEVPRAFNRSRGTPQVSTALWLDAESYCCAAIGQPRGSVYPIFHSEVTSPRQLRAKPVNRYTRQTPWEKWSRWRQPPGLFRRFPDAERGKYNRWPRFLSWSISGSKSWGRARGGEGDGVKGRNEGIEELTAGKTAFSSATVCSRAGIAQSTEPSHGQDWPELCHWHSFVNKYTTCSKRSAVRHNPGTTVLGNPGRAGCTFNFRPDRPKRM
ncbi:uncharacterized protein BDW70DRAFT_61559 [Aspergillus foveolatus]|uniref:uncharacterized protein n=1 Tax=Aspergillus foveolatus TaxID=210207 RepID=UPI003CCCB8C9